MKRYVIQAEFDDEPIYIVDTTDDSLFATIHCNGDHVHEMRLARAILTLINTITDNHTS